MCMESLATHSVPNWDALFEFAVGQEGYFTTEQAAKAGYSPQHRAEISPVTSRKVCKPQLCGAVWA